MKKSRIVVLAIGLILSVSILGLILFPKLQYGYMFPRKAKKQLESLETNLTEEQKEAFDGTVISFEDGSWVAIVYRDYHRDLIPNWNSRSYALTSEGNTYRSDEHFCGGLSGHLNMLKRNIQQFEESGYLWDDDPEAKAEQESYLKENSMYQLHSARTIDGGVVALENLGFYGVKL